MLMKGKSQIGTGVKNILLIQLGDIGDVLYSFPCARAIREKFPDSRLVLAVREKAIGLLCCCDWIDDFISIDTGARGVWDEVVFQKKFWERVRAYRFDLAVDLRLDCRSAILAFLSGARIRIGPYAVSGGEWRNRLFTHLVEQSTEKGLYIVDHYMEILNPFGITTVYRTPEISVSIEQQAAVERLFADEGIPTSKPIVAIHPFSLWQYKEWSLGKFISLILRLSDELDLVFVICGAENDRRKAQEITDQCKGNVYNLAGKTTMELLPCLLSVATLFIGVDSVGIHLAAAVGVPTVCLYGPSSPVTWAPQGKMHRVVQKNMSCVPCEQTGCQGNMKSRCMDDLSVEEVHAVVHDRLLELLA